MIDVRLVDGATGKAARVSDAGELVIGAAGHSDPRSVYLDAVDTAYNIRKPVSGQQYVITAIILATNLNIGVGGATVIFYEASTEDTATVDKIIFQAQILKNSSFVITGIDWEVSEGKFLNAKTDDDDVYVTIATYMTPAHDDNPALLGIGADV